jgi:hypothetical protein
VLNTSMVTALHVVVFELVGGNKSSGLEDVWRRDGCVMLSRD